MMATTIRARIYARGEVSFAKFLFFAKLVCQTVGGQFFLFCQNYINAKLICQTVGVALRGAKLGALVRRMWKEVPFFFKDRRRRSSTYIYFTTGSSTP
jgi:hypothetical protein